MGTRELLRRLLRRGPRGPVAYDPADPALRVVAEAFDAARADSAVIAAARGLDPDRPVLLRQHLLLPPGALAAAGTILADEGWAVAVAVEDPVGGPSAAGHVLAYATRTQVLTALSAAQERSRMAGLAQRLGGDVAGWDALQVPAPTG